MFDSTKAIRVLREFGYSDVNKHPFPVTRHYSRLQKENRIAAVEIHNELIIEKYTNEFNYSFVEKDTQLIKGVTVLSYANKLNLSIIANQINDSGFYYKTMALRNAYDVFLLSKKTNAKDAVNSLNKLSHPLNCFLAACYEVFNKVEFRNKTAGEGTRKKLTPKVESTRSNEGSFFSVRNKEPVDQYF